VRVCCRTIFAVLETRSATYARKAAPHEELERDFRPLLLTCLAECANGRFGLFGQNDDSELARYYRWQDAERVKAIGAEIRALRSEFGEPNPLVERYLHLCSLRGSNVPGEPKLAKALRDDIARGVFS
jgi:hypothetical protein